MVPVTGLLRSTESDPLDTVFGRISTTTPDIDEPYPPVYVYICVKPSHEIADSLLACAGIALVSVLLCWVY